MKFLLAIMVSTMFTASAFAACDKSSLKECKTASECEKLSTEGGVQYVFAKVKGSDGKVAEACMTKGDAVASNCVGINGSTLNTDGTPGSDKKDGAGAGKGTTR